MGMAAVSNLARGGASSLVVWDLAGDCFGFFGITELA